MPSTPYFSEDYLSIRLAVYSRMMLDKVCNSESLPVPGKGCGPGRPGQRPDCFKRQVNAISFGPLIRRGHSPQEYFTISSVVQQEQVKERTIQKLEQFAADWAQLIYAKLRRHQEETSRGENCLLFL